MEVGVEDQLTRRERLRAEREFEHAAPARIRLKLAGVVVIVIGLLSWLAVSFLSSGPTSGALLPEPPPLEDTVQGAEPQGAEPQGTEPQGTGPQGTGQTGAGRTETSGQAGQPGAPQSPGAPGPQGGAGPPGAGAGPPGESDSSPVVVHVGGAVEEPGVVELVSGARVHEAIDAAGGMTSEADPGGLNLAAPVQDGTLIWVPTPEELETGVVPPAGGQDPAGQGGAGTPGAPPGTGPGPEPGAGTGSGAGGLINLNTADAATLDELPGIGPALSERIISHRETNGPFGSLEELAGVSGIGPVILADVEDLVTW